MKKNHVPLLILILLALAFFVRVYRIDQLLGFYYDQGRDGLVIWDLWHKGKLFLIGPTTGIEGIFRGPFYYWLIAPAYLLGGGNPVWPSVFLSLTSIMACYFVWLNGRILGNKWTGILSLVISGFAFNFVIAARWFSNPTPMFLVSMLLIWALFQIMQGKKLYWLVVGLMLGMAMQFGSAAEIFYFPAVLVFSLWQRKNLPSAKVGLLALLILFLTFLPQIYFDIKHEGILRTGLGKFLFEKGSFRLSFWDVVKIRFPFYWDVFFGKLFVSSVYYRKVWSLVFAILLLLGLKKFWRNNYLEVILLLLAAPILGMLFFQGNSGNVYDYYFTGYYLIFILLFSYLISLPDNRILGKILVLVFLYFFIKDNIPLLRNYLIAGVDGPTTIALGNEVQAVDWVLSNAHGEEFNQDVYVPPVIPYAYDYLFLWRARGRCGQNLCNMQLGRRVPVLYTLYEVDPPHPERLDAWLERQKGIGVVEETTRFGGITVERRKRMNNEATGL